MFSLLDSENSGQMYDSKNNNFSLCKRESTDNCVITIQFSNPCISLSDISCDDHSEKLMDAFYFVGIG